MAGVIRIENDNLIVAIAEKGAELQSIVDKKTGIEYMWNADPAFWAKTSPVLFPIVGTLQDNTYFYNHNKYELHRHGFARDKTFGLISNTKNECLFSLKSNAETLLVYPFHFEFEIKYTLDKYTLQVGYIVKNTGEEKMYFSVGGHPAFKIPIFEGDAYTDYEIIFNKNENAGRWPITADGLIAKNLVPFFNNTHTIPLSKDLFLNDAIVFKHILSDEVLLLSKKHQKGIKIQFAGFPFLGIWSAHNANFVCIEPWCGIADSENSNQELIHKEGIHELEPRINFSKEWSVTIIQ